MPNFVFNVKIRRDIIANESSIAQISTDEEEKANIGKQEIKFMNKNYLHEPTPELQASDSIGYKFSWVLFVQMNHKFK